MPRLRKEYIEEYRCGCSDGPSPRSELLGYCRHHGEKRRGLYPMLKAGPEAKGKVMPYHRAAESARELADYLSDLSGNALSMGDGGREKVRQLLAAIREDLADELGDEPATEPANPPPQYTVPLNLIDAAARNRENPAGFQVPPPQAIAALAPGNFVKIGVEFKADEHVLNLEGITKPTGERFWVRLDACKHGIFYGVIDNDLVYTHIHGLRADQPVGFLAQHILDVRP